MTQTENLFLRCVRLSLHPEERPSFPPEDCALIASQLPQLRELAEKHSLTSCLYESLCLLELPLPAEERRYYRQRVTGSALAAYHMLAFTRMILDILAEEHITYFLLKGATLLECFPKLELRPFGDVDVLVPDPHDFQRLKTLLLSRGFVTESSFSQHHIEMYYTREGVNFLLEIHHKVIAPQTNANFNRRISEIFRPLSPVAGNYAPADLSYQMLPVTENALYLLLHMLQHFLGSGFGVRLLCDWMLYLEKHGAEISREQFVSCLHQLGLEKFCCAATALCEKFLGLHGEDFSFLHIPGAAEETNYLDAFMEEILEAGTFGKSDQARMLIMADGGRYSQYLIELHRQMKKRFQTFSRIVPLWPVLWIITGVCFLWNNHFLRRTRTRDIFATARRRQRLMKNMKLFQKGGGRDEG